jgi:hypothetical protein
MRTDRRTDMRKLIDSFRNFANGLKNDREMETGVTRDKGVDVTQNTD